MATSDEIKGKGNPQQAIDEFWAKFTSQSPGKVTTIIPQGHSAENLLRRRSLLLENLLPEKIPPKLDITAYAQPVSSSYDAAAALCRAKVQKISTECRRINKKYRDAHFDIEADLKSHWRDCLDSISNEKDGDSARRPCRFNPKGARRVADIFDEPQFFIDGPSATDVHQGHNGDCWLLSALCTLSKKEGVIEKVCVAKDASVGVYGFVFHRDGEWNSEIVDDFLYTIKSDYDEANDDRILFDELERRDAEDLYRKVYQSNSGALYFAQCSHQQETWLPLLEKCYAKAHGDFAAINGGFGGEGIEDMTGGVTSEILTADILDRDRFWQDLCNVNKEFFFSCATGIWGWPSMSTHREGIFERHSYSVQAANEVDGKRFVRLQNPWGKGEWKGPWSDGSKEWTSEWMEKLKHAFGDDGHFLIEYKDLLRKFQMFERTRLFQDDWQVAQIWTTLDVPWMSAYNDDYFTFTIARSGRVVIALSQLDDRYFRGLEGQYFFRLSFRLHRAGKEDYLVRSQVNLRLRRSVSVELDRLEAGDYDVRVKVDAQRLPDRLSVEEVIRQNAKTNKSKLARIGMAYDIAHSKGRREVAKAQAKTKKYTKALGSKDPESHGTVPYPHLKPLSDPHLKPLSEEPNRQADSARGEATDKEPDEFERDPWNAVVVVGLRVFHLPTIERKPEKEIIILRVVRPGRSGTSNEDREAGEVNIVTLGLDVDDSSKDATLAGNLMDRKRSIVGDEAPPWLTRKG